MLKLEKYSADKTYMFPNGAIATSEEIKRQFPAVELFAHVLELNGDVVVAVENLAALRSIYNVDPTLTEAEAIAAIEVIVNTPPPEVVVSPEERIAAMLEYQTMMMM